jgi:hypothetical protein
MKTAHNLRNRRGILNTRFASQFPPISAYRSILSRPSMCGLHSNTGTLVLDGRKAPLVWKICRTRLWPE